MSAATPEARIQELESLVDGYVLNLSNGPRLKLAQDALIREAAKRHPYLWKRIKRSAR